MSDNANPDTSAGNESSSCAALFLAGPLMSAAAGGMGWGIRGQYGHQWGAMVPGVLVGFVLVFLYCKRASSLYAARAIALTAIGFSFGGIMTYGQTVGLSHDTALVGNHGAYWWGMLGLFIKGGLWVGFGGAFLGIGLSGRRYRSGEFVVLYGLLLALAFVGIQIFNRPYVPGTERTLAWYYFPSASAERTLPWLYFSDHWAWEPDKLDIDPRPEIWGGLLTSLSGLIAYVWFFKKDKLARNMALVGVLGGGLGFSFGQMLQAKHTWTPNWLVDFDATIHRSLPSIFPEEFFSLMSWNWWNMMETTFGAIFGFVLGLGLWFNRKLIADEVSNDTDERISIPVWSEWMLVLAHAWLLYLWSVPRLDAIDLIADYPLAMGLVPIVCILGGRYWPYLFALPMVTIPIAGITLKNSETHHTTDQLLLLFLPLTVMTIAALYFQRRGQRGGNGREFARHGLILSIITYYSLNFVMFDYPWATLPVGGRHTNNWIFLRCAEFLIVAALFLHRRRPAIPHAKR